ncbi:MAG: DUF3891 family protein [Leptolyngbyaceae cyanobacterium bins.349]|nr:DUF3891 family protein [Leptolyngbyaceae cyanobacterium bins.349]
MIVNLAQTGWEIIYHRAHALLAAQLAGQWQRANAPERLYETIAAISHHDDLEKEWEGNELTDAGAPLDFTLGRSSDIEPLRQHLENAYYRGRWVTLLNSKHICFLNQDQWGSSKEWDEFLNEQVQNQETWRKALGISKDQAERAYQFMLWCDTLSLILARKRIPDAGRSLEITSGIDNQRYDLRQLENGCLTVEPWCFEEDQFTVNVETSCLSQLQFENNAELVAALKSAPIKILEWTFIKSDQ